MRGAERGKSQAIGAYAQGAGLILLCRHRIVRRRRRRCRRRFFIKITESPNFVDSEFFFYFIKFIGEIWPRQKFK